jgi:hypothetical protein
MSSIQDKDNRYLGNPNLPTVDTTYDYSDPKYAKELLKCKKDISYFAQNYFYITNLDDGKQTIKLYPAQKRVLKASQKHRFMVLLASRQSGKALALDTPIPTPNGWMTMGQLKDGDTVYGSSGRPVKIIKSWDIMYDRRCYRVTFDNGEQIVADKDHNWFTQSKSERRKGVAGSVKTTEEILKTLRCGVSDKEPAHRIFSLSSGVCGTTMNLSIEPYILGLWLGDGASDSSVITIGRRDIGEIISILKQYDRYNLTVNEYKKGVYSVRLEYKDRIKTDPSLQKLLRENSLIGNKHIPIEYMLSDRAQRLELLQGLMDSDGDIDSKGNGVFYNTNLSLALQVKELIESLGYKTTYRTYIPQLYGVDCAECASVSFVPRELVCRLSFKSLRIKIKNNEEISKYRNQWHYIKNIEPVDSVPVRCITVDSPDGIFLCGRQYIPTHNTTVMTIYSLWIACFEFDKRILIIANKEDTAIMILRRIRMAYEQLPNWLKPGVKQWGKTEVIFSNDSSIAISTTSSTAARGDSINVLILDETAHIPKHLLDELWASVIPVISSSRTTKIFSVSTPSGRDNKFYELYSQSENGTLSDWHHERIDWWDIPGRGKLWKNEMIQALGSEEMFRQEFGCEFLDKSDTAVDEEMLRMLKSNCEAPLYTFDDGAYEVWEDPKPDHLYVIGVDVGEGVEEAASVAQIIDLTDLTDIRQVGCYYTNSLDPYHFATKLYSIAHEWGRPYLLIERNNCGGQVIDNLHEVKGYEKIIDYTPEKQKYYNRLGIYSHTNSKYKGVTNMRYWMNGLRVVTIRDIKLATEFQTFVRHPNGTWKKQSSKFRDDRVMGIMWGLFALETDIAEKYFDVVEYDTQGRPSRINNIVVENPTFFKLDSFYTSPNSPPPVHLGIDPTVGFEEDELGFNQLMMKGWKPL